MWHKLSGSIRTQFRDLVVCQEGEPKDGPVLISNYYRVNKVNKQLMYYIVAEHSQRSVNKIYIRNEAYDKWGKTEKGFALVVDIIDENCVIQEVCSIQEAISEINRNMV